MEEIYALIIEYASIWAPSLVAVLGVVTTVLTAINKTKEAVDNFKNTEGALKDELKEVRNRLTQIASENETLIQVNKDLVDSMKTIKNYTDSSRGKIDD